jgi:hypothetical protein
VLTAMKKPEQRTFLEFADAFTAASKRAGKEQYLVPYFIASHPGSTPKEMIELAVFLKRNGYRPRQVQDFIPAPMDVATCMWHTGLDPFTLAPVKTCQRLRDRMVQRALMQFFKPENWFTVRRALLDEGRGDLIGGGRECLIPSDPPPEALDARRRAAERAARSGGARGPGPEREGEDADDDADAGPAADSTYTHAEDAGTSPTVAPKTAPSPRTIGYRPHRAGAGRRDAGNTPRPDAPGNDAPHDDAPKRGPDRGPPRGPRRPHPPAR